MSGALWLLAGVLSALAATRLPPATWLWCAAVAVAAVLLTPLRHGAATRPLALLLAGLWLAWTVVAHWQSLYLPPAARDERVLLDARIASVPARHGAEVGFDAEVRIASGPGAGGARRRARLRWRDAAVVPRVGERWQLLARLGEAGETRNFHGVDAGRLAFRDGVHLVARVLPSALNSRLALAPASIDTLRARIAMRIAGRVDDPDAAALITALAVGLTAGMSTDQWRVFNATGTTHLVAISGLHVTLFAWLAFGAARVAWRWLPAGRALEREPFAVLLGLAAAGGYALLAGFSVPTQRTWLMLAVFAWARLAARPLDAARTWSLALIAVLLLDPLAPLAAGFWLSFVAVGVILLREPSSLLAPQSTQLLRLQFAVMLMLAPLTFAVFGAVSLVGFAVNLLAIPIISFVFVPLVLIGACLSWWVPVLDEWPFVAAATLYEWLWPGLVWAADLELATWRIAPPPWWYLLTGPAALLAWWRWPPGLRFGGAAVLLLPLVFMPSRLPAPGDVRVAVLDAGRGTAVLVATRTRALLFDTGDSWNTHGATAARVVLPAMDALGIRRIDLLVLPRLDPDRAAAAALLAVDRGVETILVGGGWPATVLPAQACRDARLEWEGAVLEFLAAGRHAESCVLRVSAGGHALLLPGDLDASAERDLLARLPPRALASDVVLMSRQAGSMGSAPEWIEASGAAWAIATGGIAASDARARTLARWRAAGVRVLDTRTHGAVQFVFGTRGIEALATAQSARHPFAWRRAE